ncbi:MAG: cysteine desulfurase family protein [Eubacteriales bacterium]
MNVYFDNAATTCPCEEATAAFTAAPYANPSSLHSAGLEAQRSLENSRKIIARTLGCKPEELYFTSGGTESNTTALVGVAKTGLKRGRRIIVSDGEHPAVTKTAGRLSEEGWDVVKIPTRDGILDLDAFEAALDEQTILVSVMSVNNETGAIYPIQKLRRIIDSYWQDKPGKPTVLHCDGVQGYMKIPFDVKKMGVDILTISGHKIHAYKGIGAMYVKRGIFVPSVFTGGGQERGMRAGTENVPGAAALAAAALVAEQGMAQFSSHVTALREYIIEGLRASVPHVKFNTPPTFSPYILSVTVPEIRSEIMLQHLSGRGIYVSSGSACSSRFKGPSATLLAYGLSDNDADCTIRVSLSRYNTQSEADALVEGIADGARSIIKVRLI